MNGPRYDKELLEKLNSLTHYPSIQTYHELGDRGILQETGNPFAGIDEMVYVTEKIDGVNGRIILWDGDWIIGSRTELLAARGDRIWPESNGIVDTLRKYAERGVGDHYRFAGPNEIWVIYAEVYGHKSTAHHRLYSNGDATGALLFDVARFDAGLLQKSLPDIAAWRDYDKDRFAQDDASSCGMLTVPTPACINSEQLPNSIGEMVEFLEKFPYSEVALQEDVPRQRPEGLVFRTRNRDVIRKARWESYDRTLRLLDLKS